METLKEKACEVCGKLFVGREAQKYCSVACKRAKKALNNRQKRGAQPRGTEKRATCAMCGRPFVYVHYSKARKYCDDCKAIANGKKRLERRQEQKGKQAKGTEKKICLFCGAEFYGNKSHEFCHDCIVAGFDEVYKFRKEQNGKWMSAGDRVRRGMAAVAFGEKNEDYTKWLRLGMTNASGAKCGYAEESGLREVREPFFVVQT